MGGRRRGRLEPGQGAGIYNSSGDACVRMSPPARFLLRRRFPSVCSHARMRDAQVGVCTRVRERESARWARGMQYAFRESVSACASAYSV